MRLYTIEQDGKAFVAIEGADGGLRTLASLGIEVRDMQDLIVRFDGLKDALAEKIAACGDVPAAQNNKLLAPIPEPAQDVICLGVNYREHIEETVDTADFTNKTATVYFSKRVTRCGDPDGIIPAFDFVDSLDYEAELAVILGKTVFQISPEEAGASIFGYAVLNDVSARTIQFKHQQWYVGKSLDGYTPMGPCIVTADEIGDAHDLDIFCFVNGEERQHSNTCRMITTPEEAISELSQGMTLKAGTIIATGTPGGVALGMKEPKYMQPGDVVCCRIGKIGDLVSTVR